MVDSVLPGVSADNTKMLCRNPGMDANIWGHHKETQAIQQLPATCGNGALNLEPVQIRGAREQTKQNVALS